jgi:hypothetical protein
MGMQTDVLGSEVIFEAGLGSGQLETKKGAGILKKTLTQATKSYQPKYMKPIKPPKVKDDDQYMIPMAKPIKEGNLNQGI